MRREAPRALEEAGRRPWSAVTHRITILRFAHATALRCGTAFSLPGPEPLKSGARAPSPRRLRRKAFSCVTGCATSAPWRGRRESLSGPGGFSWRREGLIEVGDQILDIFDADRQADEAVGKAALQPEFPRDGGVRHESRRLDQRLHAPE
jgi:hypothetical protein